jgi:hypothetical protein
VVARSVEMVTIGGGDPCDAELMLLREARERDPRHHAKVGRGWRLERLPDRRMAAHPPPRPDPVWGPAIHAPPPGG